MKTEWVFAYKRGKTCLSVFLAVIIVVLLALLEVGCKERGQQEVSVIGSTSIQPFAELLGEEFHKKHPGTNIVVQGGGSTAGLQALASGIADIGMCSRPLSSEEANVFVPIVIARDGLAIVVHPNNPIKALTLQQVHKIFSGQITNWKELGGNDQGVRLIMREEGSGTREAFVKLVMGKMRVSPKALVQESNGAVKELVKSDPAGIGYMSLGLVGGEVKALIIDGVTPVCSEVAAARYPLSRPFLLVVKTQPQPSVQEFIDFVLSPEGQRTLEMEGLVRAK